MVYLNRVPRCTLTHFRAQRPIAAKWRNTNGFEEKENPPGWNPEGPRGADGNRNHDLFDANEALYQLSYSPVDVVLLRRTTIGNYSATPAQMQIRVVAASSDSDLW